MALSKNISETAPSFTIYKGTKLNLEDAVINGTAYIKVESVTSSKTVAKCTVSFKVDDLPAWESKYSFEPSLDGDNFIAQAYEYLKTLPEFSDAVDC